MKKIIKFNALLFASLLVFSACNQTAPVEPPVPVDPPEEDPIYDEPKLEADKSEDYVLENVSNENSSMGYEIFVRSFYDTDGDGIGDLKGVEQKLPYLSSLGVKTLWLMPIHPSPTYHGYDVKDYYAVSSDYGTLADFDSLVTAANGYNIDIMLDMVFNHCSDQNPWFIQSYQDFKSNNTSEDSKKEWFSWASTGGGIYTKNFRNDTAAWYEARFDGSMPDFNFDCQAVRNEIENIMKFWIVDHGVKGFRLDAVKYYYYEDVNKNIPVLTWLEETAHKYDPNFYMVGECWSDEKAINNYQNSKIDSLFRFEASYEGSLSILNMAKGRNRATKFIDSVVANVNSIKSNNSKAYPSYFISNHDMNRSVHAFSSDSQIKCAASLLAFLPGTSYMYYGEEIGLMGKRKSSPDDYSDARRRLPMIWSETDKTGECAFPEKNRQDLATNDQVKKGVNDRLEEKFSVVKHYQKVINVRNKYPFIKMARVESLVGALNTEFTNVLAYKLYNGNDYIIVVHNFGEQNVKVNVVGSEIVDAINTSHQIPTYQNNELVIGSYSTVIIK